MNQCSWARVQLLNLLLCSKKLSLQTFSLRLSVTIATNVPKISTLLDQWWCFDTYMLPFWYQKDWNSFAWLYKWRESTHEGDLRLIGCIEVVRQQHPQLQWVQLETGTLNVLGVPHRVLIHGQECGCLETARQYYFSIFDHKRHESSILYYFTKRHR